MPVEIRELVIKATISNASVQELAGSTIILSLNPAEQEALITSIAERVLELMDKRPREISTSYLPASFEIPPGNRKLPL